MACARCPYTTKFELLWTDDADPDVIAVLLRCCAGPELQIRRGTTLLYNEIFKTVPAVRDRAAELRGQPIPVDHVMPRSPSLPAEPCTDPACPATPAAAAP
ncbi:MAG: hypothetical protein ABL961_17005 [Vicinamibacterales bacterium]